MKDVIQPVVQMESVQILVVFRMIKMNDEQVLNNDYQIDEYGRIVITNIDFIKSVSGTKFIPFMATGTNTACGSNGACANVSCKIEEGE